ncbi:Scorpion toxin-like protein [Dioscorea alata]|uniref:Scorpion toxin-like protein n=1 Tax=Dioscorea alata TaxID=55571 RepID=A0ACB7UUX6_DIOAL|nr:Scorpion toxin-like protein [Dioscorea alata]
MAGELFSRRMVSAIVLVMLLLITHEMGTVTVVDARKCTSQSHKFKGQCWSDTNCANVCHNEGFPGGECMGFRRRCFCKKECH